MTGHDEDGDGVPDVIDVCPHLPGSQLDSDGDGIGDDCDPEPTIPRQHLLLFATMQHGDQPLGIAGAGTWAPQPDAIRYDGTADGDLSYTFTATNVRIAIGVDIYSLTGDSTNQHQIAMGNYPQGDPRYFSELDQQNTFEVASITQFDGVNYTQLMTQPLPNGVHSGSVFDQLTVTGPPTGGVFFSMTLNHMVADVRYVWIVIW